MRVLYLHQYFTFPTGVGGTRSYYFAKKLVDSGHEVIMICGKTAGADTGIPAGSSESRIVREGIEVITINTAYSSKQPFARRVLSFFAFSLRGIKAILTEEYDCIYATSTPLTIGILPLVAKFFRRKKYIFEVRDLWPDVPKELGIIKSKLVLKVLYAFEKLVYKYSEACVGLSPGMVSGIKSKVKNKRVYLLPNACDIGFFMKKKEDLIYPPEGFQKKEGDLWLGFTGSHGFANGLGFILDAANLLREKNNIKFVLVGDGPLKKNLVKRAVEEELDNCIFLDSIPKNKLKNIFSLLDIGLMILKGNETFQEGTSPNKFFDYLACGLPIIVNYTGWMSRIISYFGVGFYVDSPRNMRDKILTMASEKKQLSKMASNTVGASELFDRNRISKDFIHVVEFEFNFSRVSFIPSSNFDYPFSTKDTA